MVAGDPCCGGVACNSYAFFLDQSLHSSEITTFQTRSAHEPRSINTQLCVSEKFTSCDMETCSQRRHLESKSFNSLSPEQTFPVPGIAPAVKAEVENTNHIHCRLRRSLLKRSNSECRLSGVSTR